MGAEITTARFLYRNRLVKMGQIATPSQRVLTKRMEVENVILEDVQGPEPAT